MLLYVKELRIETNVARLYGKLYMYLLILWKRKRTDNSYAEKED